MIRRHLSLALCILAVVAAVAVTFVGRAANPADSLPRLMSSSDSTTIYVDFVSVVNLPLGARVLARGTQIGTLADIELVPDAARLTLHLDNDARVPVGSKAELRQSTMLGDIYVALTPPPGHPTRFLASGDRISLADSDPGPQIEDIITNLADFMAGGSVMRVQDALRQVNASVGVKDADLGSASHAGARSVDELAAGTTELGTMIDKLAEVSAEIASKPADLGYAFGPAGHVGLDAVFDSVNEGFKLVAGSSKLAFGLNWLTPRLAQLNPFLDKLVPLLRSYSAHSTEFNGNAGALIGLTENKLIPFARNGGISVGKVTLGSDASATQPTIAVLRMIGALR